MMLLLLLKEFKVVVFKIQQQLLMKVRDIGTSGCLQKLKILSKTEVSAYVFRVYLGMIQHTEAMASFSINLILTYL